MPEGVKFNQQVYKNLILKNVVVPFAQQNYGNEFWMFQQDSAPAHKARLTVQYWKKNFPDLISPMEWPPYSPDLNLLDYSVWNILETKTCVRAHNDLEALKQSLIREWAKITKDTLRENY